MKFQKILLFICIIFNSLFIFLLIAHIIILEEKLWEKTLTVQDLQSKILRLESKTTFLEKEVEKLEFLLRNISEEEELELRNPTWDELKTFLEADDTNKLIYNETFDCSGFAVELFKRVRNVGFRCAFVEIRFEGDSTAHALNAFQTDKGLLFIDVTGDRDGTGKDKIAYVKVGMPYGTINLEGLIETRIDCNIDCEQFTKELNYVDYANLFDYDYFLGVKKCKELYEKCADEYNIAIQFGNYTYSEINKWYENLEKLRKEVGSEKYYYISEWDRIVESIEIYW
jgi:hypothetical protein